MSGSPLKVGPLAIRTPTGVMMQGEVVNGHAHEFDHVTVCLAGAIRVHYVIDGKRFITEIWAASKDKPRQFMCNIRAGIEHELEALEDNTQYGCFYPHRKANGEVVEEYTGWLHAYA